EDIEYVESIKNDVEWLGFHWSGNVRYSSDYFDHSTRRSHRARRGRPVYAQPVSPRVSYNTPNLAGRWSLLQVEPLNDTERM
ncbi:glutamate--tRNA ligase family protein, partial [Klebsiella pneumoniae]|uniref:glutamate--tRNA ligase family protein n=1 Tax=Klebsiella pneumoniae TaxID=573 RepID=UPI002731C19E